MPIIIPIVTIGVLCVAFFTFVLLRNRTSQAPQVSTVQLYIPFSDVKSLDLKKFSQQFNAQWGYPVDFKPDNGDSNENAQQKYLLRGGDYSVTFIYSVEPIHKDFTNLLTNSIYKMTDEERTNLLNHKGYVNISVKSDASNINKQILFAGDVLLSLLNQDKAIGYSDVAAQNFKSKSQIPEAILTKKELSMEDLYLLFVSVQQVQDDKSNWFHTHGLEQFNLPNLEISCRSERDSEYYQMALDSTAVYMLENGNILKSGDIAEILGDGVLFSISGRKDNDSPTGILTLTTIKK